MKDSSPKASIMPLVTNSLSERNSVSQEACFFDEDSEACQLYKVKKMEQMNRVTEIVRDSGFIPENLISNEVAWFFQNLGIDDIYFAKEADTVIAGHILMLYAAKLNAYVNNKDELDINLAKESDQRAVYIQTSKPGIKGNDIEVHIDEKYLNASCKSDAYRMETYRSRGTISSKHDTNLRCYFISKCQFVIKPMTLICDPSREGKEEVDIRSVSDKTFLEKVSPRTLEIYQKMIINILQRAGPVIEVYDTAIDHEKRLVIGFKQQTTKGFFSSLSDLYHFYGLYSTKKFVEQFSNGITIMSIYLNPIVSDESNSSFPPIENSILQIMKESSLIYCIPTNPLKVFFQEQKLSIQEMVYGWCALVFAQHFLNRLGNEYAALKSTLDENNPAHIEVLTKLKKRLRQDTFTREYVLDIVLQHPELIKILYQHFGMVHYVSSGIEPTSIFDRANEQKNNSTVRRSLSGSKLRPTLSFARLYSEKIWTEAEIMEKIKKTASNNHQQMVFESFLTFNAHILKTNFYQPTKVALSFRIDPSFLPFAEYPQIPFGMFLVIGNEFRGFHVRFQEIARGGIRIIKSRNKESYSINFRGLFDENYALAATQQRKNKDIPEGGSKGTILLDYDCQDKSKIAFEKYIDSMIDLIVEGDSPGIKEKLVDLYGKNEIIFFGPDEGSAEFMDMACQHAKARGVKYWKAFTTGKSSFLGGIPHDLYGMTTRSIHQYKLGLYRKFGLKEENITKVQTGGPDGDLGSNEIKISKDKTIAIIDGSGVAYDPQGLDRSELMRLAGMRGTIVNFDTSKLSSNGYVVAIDERDRILPDGHIVEDGLLFRNEFHLSEYAVADLFVPCGGRPEAVDVGNWQRMLKGDGSPKFSYIIEGANLFFTQEARTRLEKSGCVIFKDASANKGGVTSSSLEVLVSLAMSDEEFEHHMTVNRLTGEKPQFYSDYVKEVHAVIEKNAELEFEAIWRENRKQKIEKSKLSDTLSLAIINFDLELQETALFDNEQLKKLVLSEAIPSLLLRTLGLSKIIERVPESYLRSMFGSYLASRFIYQYGDNSSQIRFFEFMSKYFEMMNQAK